MNSIYLYGTIGEDWWDSNSVPAADFVKQLNAFGGEPVDIYINSYGGSVFDACAIYSAIQRYEGHVRAFVDGLAASAASFCALSADEVLISPSGTVMIHDPLMIAAGNAKELRAAADELDIAAQTIRNIYASKTGKDDAEIAEAMAAETWFTAAEAIEYGLADGYCQEKKIAAAYNKKAFAFFKNVPDNLREVPSAQTTETDPQPQTDDENATLAAENTQQEGSACNAEMTITTDEKAPAAAGKPRVAVFAGKVYEIGEKPC